MPARASDLGHTALHEPRAPADEAALGGSPVRSDARSRWERGSHTGARSDK
jgi:hypothetical protein